MDHDLEAAVPNEASSEPSPPFTHANTQHHSGFAKDGLRSTRLRTSSITVPRPVYAPFQHGISSPNGVGNEQRERARSLSSLSWSPLSHTDEPSLGELYPPPEYSFLPGSPRNPTPAQESIVQVARFLEAGAGEKETNHASALSAPNISWLSSKPAEWREFPLSHSQPAMKGISDGIFRNSVSSARHTFSTSSGYTPRASPAPTVDDHTQACGTLLDDQPGPMSPRPSLSSEKTGSDSIAAISPCHMVATPGRLSGAEDVPSCSDDPAFNDSRHAATASESEGLEGRHIDEDGQDCVYSA